MKYKDFLRMLLMALPNILNIINNSINIKISIIINIIINTIINTIIRSTTIRRILLNVEWTRKYMVLLNQFFHH